MSDNENLVNEQTSDVANVSDEVVTESSPEIESSKEAEVELNEEKNENPEVKEDPEYIKRRLGKQQKKYERQLAEVNEKLTQAQQALNSRNQLGINNQIGQQNIVYDDWTGKAIDVNSEEGQAILKYRQDIAEVVQRDKESKAAESFSQHKKELIHHIEDSFDDAKEKYSDFATKVYGELPFNDEMVTAIGLTPNPGELTYYLASNPKEVVRISKLPALQAGREIMRHMLEMNSKKTVSKTPAPVKPVGQGSSAPNKSWGKESYKEIKERKMSEQSRGRR